MIKINSRALFGFLEPLTAFIGPGNVNPLFECFLFQFSDGLVTVRAQSPDKGAKRKLIVDSQIEGTFCVPVKILMETLKGLPDLDVEVSVLIKRSIPKALVLSTESGSYTIGCVEAEGFPRFKAFPKQLGGSVQIFIDLLNQVSFSTSDDELRPALNAVYIKPNTAVSEVVATDGTRLALCKTEKAINDMISSPILIHHRFVNVLKSILRWNKGQDVSMAVEGKHAFFHCNGIYFFTTLIEESFPDYHSVIPSFNNAGSVCLVKTDIQFAIMRAFLFSDLYTKAVVLETKGDALHVYSKNEMTGQELGEKLACKDKAKDFKVAFNGKLLLDMIREVPGDEVILKVISGKKPALITGNKPESEMGYSYSSILMPVAI